MDIPSLIKSLDSPNDSFPLIIYDETSDALMCINEPIDPNLTEGIGILTLFSSADDRVVGISIRGASDALAIAFDEIASHEILLSHLLDAVATSNNAPNKKQVSSGCKTAKRYLGHLVIPREILPHIQRLLVAV